MYKVIFVLFSVSLSVKTIYIVLMITGRKKNHLVFLQRDNTGTFKPGIKHIRENSVVQNYPKC